MTKILEKMLDKSSRINMMTLLLLTLSSLLSACDVGDSPEHNAKQFWLALQRNDIEQAQQLATQGSRSRVTVQEGRTIENLRFAQAEQQTEHKASLETEFDVFATGADRDSEPPFHLIFNTVLQREEGVWKIDFDRTLASMIGHTFRELGNDFKESLQEAGEAAADFTNESIIDVMQQMTEALQEATGQMQEAAEEMKEARDESK